MPELIIDQHLVVAISIEGEVIVDFLAEGLGSLDGVVPGTC